MGVRNAENLQHALQRTVFAGAAVENIKGQVGLQVGQHRGDVASDIDSRRPVTEPRQRLGAGCAGAQRDLPLGRPASHQNGDVLVHTPPWPIAPSALKPDSLHAQ